MELLLPVALVDALSAEQLQSDRARAEAAVDVLLAEVDAARDRMVEVATVDGGRRMTAAVFLYRAVTLLHEIRAATPTPSIAILGLRTVYELAVVGRYLLVGGDAADEFMRRYNDSLQTDAKMAESASAVPAPPADFLGALVDAGAKPPRDLATLATQLDKLDGRDADETYSLKSCYRLLYKHVANSASHASLSSTKRMSRREGDVLHLDAEPGPLFTQVPTLIASALVSELARALFEAMNLPVEGLPAQISRPRTGDST